MLIICHCHWSKSIKIFRPNSQHMNMYRIKYSNNNLIYSSTWIEIITYLYFKKIKDTVVECCHKKWTCRESHLGLALSRDWQNDKASLKYDLWCFRTCPTFHHSSIRVHEPGWLDPDSASSNTSYIKFCSLAWCVTVAEKHLSCCWKKWQWYKGKNLHSPNDGLMHKACPYPP